MLLARLPILAAGQTLNKPCIQVNFFAREEHDSLPNYKLLQSGLSALGITREINVQKLLRGSKVDTLELLQYLFKHLKREYVVLLNPSCLMMSGLINAGRLQ